MGIGMSLLISWHLNDTFLLTERFELPAFLFSTGLFCVIIRMLPRGRREHPVLQRVAGYSLDVWMVHMIWLNVLFALPVFHTLPMPLAVLLLTASCTLCSLGSMWLGRTVLSCARWQRSSGE